MTQTLSPISAPSKTQTDAAEFQCRMVTLLVQASVGNVEAHTQLYSLRVLATIALTGFHGQLLRAIEPSLALECGGVKRLETLPISERVVVLAWLGRCHRGWPESFRELADNIGLTQQSFARSGLGQMQCDWLTSEVHRLPIGFPRRKGRRINQVIAMLNTGAGNKKHNWRAVRAALLMRKVVAHGN